MRVCHGLSTVFDDPDLVSCAGLAPVFQLAERAGLQRLVAEHVQLGKPWRRQRAPEGRLCGCGDGRRGGLDR